MREKEFFSTSEAAKLLGVSRIAIFKKIKSGEIRGEKIGRNFVIRKNELPDVLNRFLAEAKKKEIEASVRRTVKEYGRTLKMLGKE